MNDIVFTIYDIDVLLSEAESAIHTSDMSIVTRKLRTARQMITDMRTDITSSLDDDLEQYRIIK
ncbi:TPA: hypothetical protein HA235_01395 [Candidatus Woesearchaeota archaeon]|nr:hypothetical protein [Candidatus Woesearchaeota archaeon]HIH31338.1 hypothetical protein [Candidatus Woesearchaeota archaeon]HIH55190.1 hypothetical protein [Candidatus Woesearchaeota archaeon]HIJ02039.1 hypothetical protein [Candidatus Woesearchaeota archaeon]HIJ13632.1 hypothetical protein [Candidatus Woesearchaeota archaeon]